MENPKLLRSHHPKHGGPPCLLEELIINILSRLPSKTLCRFKCVSKDFLFLISSDSQFKDLHRIQSLKIPRLLQYDLIIPDGSDGLESNYLLSQTTFDITSGQECDKFDLVISKGSRNKASFIQVTSCRELVCIYTYRQIMVLNPSTHQLISLAAGNEIRRNSVGIGYVDSCKEYKVVRINREWIFSERSPEIYHDLGCQVYTVKDGSYGYTVSTKIFEGTPQDNLYDVGLVEHLPICVDGVLYWMSVTCSNTKKMVVSFLNLKDDSYGKYPFPEGDIVGKEERGGSKPKLIELEGYLCILCSSLISEGFLVYALKDTKLGLWEQVYNIPYPPGIDWSWKFLFRVPLSRHEIVEYTSYMPAMSYTIPKVLGFLPLNYCGNGVPDLCGHEIVGYTCYTPAMSYTIPKEVGFLPSNDCGNGVPDLVLSEHVGNLLYRFHVVENGTIKTSTDIGFSLRKTLRLSFNEGLFSFKSF